MMRSRIGWAIRALTIAAVVGGMAATAAAQETTGTITGAAKDQSGAVLPGVTVTVKSVQTGSTQEFVTNESGLYTAPALQPGEYEVTFALSGFQARTIKGIQLHVNDRLEVNGQLGVSNVDVGSNITLLSTPTLESIQEFKIITSSYAAEFPRSGGGVVNIVTKGGSQKFQGTAYDFVRNDRFNANSFFRNRSTDPAIRGSAPRLRYQNPGYTIGGPLLPSRQKAFFFWSEEWRYSTRAPASQTASVVNPAWLSDPSNPNYVDPSQRDPNAVKLLQLWPAPNFFTAAGTAQYLNSTPSVNNTRQEVIRTDVDLSNRWKLVGRYTHDLSNTVEPGGLFTGIVVPFVSATHTGVPGQVLAVELRGT